MRRPSTTRSFAASFGAAILLVAGAAPAAAPTGRAALADTWLLRGGRTTMITVQGGAPPFQPQAGATYAKNTAAIKAGTLSDGLDRCLAPGIPRLMYAPYPIQILVKPEQVTIIHEMNHWSRLIYLDQPPPPDLDESYLGYSSGHWDGDTLVVETTGMNDTTFLDGAGMPHSTALKVTEQLRVIDRGRILEDLITIDDPKTFTRPWSARITFDRQHGRRLRENLCFAKSPKR